MKWPVVIKLGTTVRTPAELAERIRFQLAFFLTGAFVGALFTFTFKTMPSSNKDILTYMVGQLSGMALMALGFYFTNKVGQDALDATRSENTGKMAEAVTAALKTGDKGEVAARAADDVAHAAVARADEIKEDSTSSVKQGD